MADELERQRALGRAEALLWVAQELGAGELLAELRDLLRSIAEAELELAGDEEVRDDERN
ncbi:MAG: hypothetical protein H5T69_00260 [Chloroflexi bacterium]|nr:hypothetical protein [Chloroflexota bacterium]